MAPLPPLAWLPARPLLLPAAAVTLRPALPEMLVPPTVPLPVALPLLGCALLPAAAEPALARTVLISVAPVPALAVCQRPMGVLEPKSTFGSSALDPQPTAAALAIT